eukprot:UN01680
MHKDLISYDIFPSGKTESKTKIEKRKSKNQNRKTKNQNRNFFRVAEPVKIRLF